MKKLLFFIIIAPSVVLAQHDTVFGDASEGTLPSWTEIWILILPILISAGILWYSRANRHRDKTYKDLGLICEIDKQLVSNPELWGLWDSNKTSLDYFYTQQLSKDGLQQDEIDERRKREEKKLEDKLMAFAYFKLNISEAAMESNHKSEMEITWEKYLVHTILHSSRFRKIIEKESRDIVYSESFKRQMCCFLSIVEDIEGDPAYNEDIKYLEHDWNTSMYLNGLMTFNVKFDPLIRKKLSELERKRAPRANTLGKLDRLIQTIFTRPNV